MGPDAAFVNQDLKAPVHPIVAIDKRLCHDRPISLMIPQDILQHPKNGAIYEVAKNEFGKHGVGMNNKHKDDKNPHDPNHGAVHNMANKATGHDKYGQNEIRHNELPLGGAHGYHGTQAVGQNQDGYDKNQHTDVRNAIHDAAHPTSQNEYGQNQYGQNQYGQTQDNYDPNQHTGVRNAIHDAAHPTSQNEYGQNQYGQNQDNYDPNQHTEARNMMHDAAHPTSQNQYGQNQYGQNQYGQNQEGYDPSQHTEARNMMHDAAHPTSQNQYGQNQYGQNQYGQTQDNYDPNQHTGVRNAIHDAAHPTSQNQYGQTQYGQNQDNYDPNQHTEARNMMHDAAHPTSQNQYGQNQYGQTQYGQNQEGYDPNQHTGVRNAIHDAAHPTDQNQYGRNETHTQHGATHGIGQNKLGHNEIGHNKHGIGNNPGKHGKGALMFDLASMPLNDRDDRVLKDSNGKPIAYLTEKNRIIQRNFVITRDPEGQDAIFDVKRKHLSKSPVRADFKDLASGRMCRLGAAVLEETHGITALLWLDNGDGTKEKRPVGRLHLPPGSNRDPNVMRATEDHHKMTDALRPVTKQQNRDADGRRSKDYQLDLMPGIDAGLAVLVAMVTAACTDHKRATDPNTHSSVTPVKHSNTA